MHQYNLFLLIDKDLYTISGHARLARNTSRNEDNLGAGQTLAEARRSRIVALDGRLSVDMADIGGNTCMGRLARCLLILASSPTWSHADIVKGELRDTGVKLHQQRQRLSDTAGSTKDRDLGRLETKS